MEFVRYEMKYEELGKEGRKVGRVRGNDGDEEK
jgi:hypothetical protein